MTSANVVGYYNNGLTQGKNKLSLIGGAMVDITTGGVQLNNGVKVTGIKGATGSAGADHLKLWDPTAVGGAGAYIEFYFYQDGDPDNDGWCDPGTDDNIEKTPKYKNGFPAGTGFWYKAADNAEKDITFSGAVEDAAYIEPPMSEGKQLTMFANAYPVMTQFNPIGGKTMVSFSGLKGATGSAGADHIKMWDPAGASGAGKYIEFYFYQDGDPDNDGWCDPGTDDNIEKTAKYKNGLPVGTAFWFKPADAKTVRVIRFNKMF